MQNEQIRLILDMVSGVMKHWEYQGKAITREPIRPNFWRAPQIMLRGRPVHRTQICQLFHSECRPGERNCDHIVQQEWGQAIS